MAGASVPEGRWDRYAEGIHTFVGTVSVVSGLQASSPGERAEVRYRPPVRQAGGTWRLVTVGSRRIQVTWGATPEQWRRERPVFERLLRSVRLVPTAPRR